jgi:hypothetical protein
MPASTPVYGITYPCGGDTIDPAVLAVFANSIDAALAQGAAELAQVTGRPNAQVARSLPAQAVILNTITTITYVDEVYDNDAMADLATNNDRLTVRTDGGYFIQGRVTAGSATTMTSVAVILTVNGIERGRSKTRPLSTEAFGDVSLSMPMNLVVGDIVRMQTLWTGTGGPSDYTTCFLSASYLAAP